jgi:hypothetical protein
VGCGGGGQSNGTRVGQIMVKTDKMNMHHLVRLGSVR